VSVDEALCRWGSRGAVISGGEYAVTTHFGPYQKLGNLHPTARPVAAPEWRELRATPCFEIYLNDRKAQTRKTY